MPLVLITKTFEFKCYSSRDNYNFVDNTSKTYKLYYSINASNKLSESYFNFKIN